MSLPPVSWTVAGSTVRMGAGWFADCNAGGHDQMRGTIPEDDWRGIEGAGQGSTVRGVGGDGLVVWEGRLTSPPQIIGGEARLAAQGWKHGVHKKTDRLLIQSRDMSIWQPLDGEPFLNANGVPFYSTHRKIETTAGNRLKWSIPLNDQVASGSRDGFGFWAEGVALARIKFAMSYATADETTDFAIEVRKADGPTGSDTAENTYNTTAANNGSTKSHVLSATRDMIILNILANANHTAASNRAYRAARIWVNSDIETGDTFFAHQILAYIGTTLGLDNGGIDSTFAPSTNLLPFDWREGSWLEAALYVAELTDGFYRVLEERTDGSGPIHEYGQWGSRRWTVTTAGATPELTPLELFDKVIVFYETPTGVLRRATATSTSISVGNAYEYRLRDRQSDATLAQAVANALLARLEVPRYVGQIDIAAAKDDKGYDNPFAIRYGDVVRIQDWSDGEALEQRVAVVEYRQGGIRVSVEQPIEELLPAGLRRRV